MNELRIVFYLGVTLGMAITCVYMIIGESNTNDIWRFLIITGFVSIMLEVSKGLKEIRKNKLKLKK